jgi:hypothetical protein
MTLSQIDPDKLYTPKQLVEVTEYKNLFSRRSIYQQIANGQLDYLQPIGSRRYLIKGEWFYNFMIGKVEEEFAAGSNID